MSHAAPQVVGIKVRMYRRLFGDCFLLTFTTADKANHYVLIDCGVHHLSKRGLALMPEVAKDIMQQTKGHLHTLAISHEHWDHLSGFVQAAKEFQGLQVDHVWLSWAEDGRDKLAQKLKETFNSTALSLQRLANHSLLRDHPLGMAISNLLGAKQGEASPGKNAQAMRFVRQFHARPYLKPGEMKTLEGIGGVRVFVLGPPRDEAAIRAEKQKSETYGAPSFDMAFLRDTLHTLGITDQDMVATDALYPFAKPYRRRVSKTGKTFFKTQYVQGAAWRKIDTDWLGSAGEMALALQSKTNNTSLVLAFDIEPIEAVLLFPGDAQVGNWLSWEKVKCPPGYQTVTGSLCEDLLSRTVLYKVGHHGSFNATLAAKGLDRMQDERLVAMIPVDNEVAGKGHTFDDIPFDPLVKKLIDATQGHVLRGDKKLTADQRATMKRAVKEDQNELYVEYTVM